MSRPTISELMVRYTNSPISEPAITRKVQHEKVLHQQISSFINAQWPGVYFFADASGMRVTPGLRNELQRKRCRKWKILDVTLLEPRGGYFGAVLEVKVNVDDVYKKDLSLKKNDHVAAQAASIEHLTSMGYFAAFVCGFDHAERVIRDYMSKPLTIKQKP